MPLHAKSGHCALRAPTVFFGTDEKHIRTKKHGYE
jgi:hypothetical protein